MIISVEGNIASGKTTVLETLRAEGLKTFPEPVEDWKEWLVHFYQDMRKWALAFQFRVLLSFLQRDYGEKAVVERSPMTCVEVFGASLHGSGHLVREEYALMLDYYKQFSWKPDVVVYVRTPPETCFERMRSRDRDGEQRVSLEYLSDLHERYEVVMSRYRGRLITVDGSRPKEKVSTEVLRLVKDVQERAARDDAARDQAVECVS
jgi:thymidine kinase